VLNLHGGRWNGGLELTLERRRFRENLRLVASSCIAMILVLYYVSRRLCACDDERTEERDRKRKGGRQTERERESEELVEKAENEEPRRQWEKASPIVICVARSRAILFSSLFYSLTRSFNDYNASSASLHCRKRKFPLKRHR
jgi:hypothetical protein